MSLKYMCMGVLLFGSQFLSKAQDAPEKFNKFQAQVEVASFNTLNWGVECGISYFPVKYAGLKLSLCGAGDFSSTAKSFFREGMMYETNDLHNGLWFRSGIVVKSPNIWKSSDASMKLSVQEECGTTFPLPSNKRIECTSVPNMSGVYVDPPMTEVKNTGGKSVFFHSKTSVVLDVDRWQFSIGYIWSNMDVYSSTRNIANELALDIPRKKCLQGINVGFGYSF